MERKHELDPDYVNPVKRARLDGSEREIHTICELHRRLFRACRKHIKPVLPEVAEIMMEDLRDAYDMGKRMGDKLDEYARERKRENNAGESV